MHGGAYRPFLHDRHFSAASSFQIGVSRGAYFQPLNPVLPSGYGISRQSAVACKDGTRSMIPIGRFFLPQNIGSSTAVPSATELKLRLVLLGFWPRAFEDFFLERRRVIVRALGPETKRQGRG